MKPNDKAYREFMRVYNKTHVSLEAQIMASLTAAFAAQFPPSEDYAGLIAKLKDDDGFNATDDDCIAAADALGALLAERDRLNGVIQSYQILLETQQGMLVATQTERDALLARLAPVEDEELVEIAADAIDTPLPSLTWEEREGGARVAIAAIRPHIEAAEREKCAKIAETPELWVTDKPSRGCDDIAAAIRSGI